MNLHPQMECLQNLDIDRVVKFLNSNYNLDVYFSYEQSHKLSDEIAALQNGILTINMNVRDNNCRVFTISHVFGHIVQYCTMDIYAELIETISLEACRINFDDPLIERYRLYEEEAFHIGLGLLKSVYEITNYIETQFQAFMKTDIHHYLTYLTTGNIYSDREFCESYKLNLQSIRSKPFHSTRFMYPPALIDARVANDLYVL
jgi:hypothetical protein